MHLSFLIFVLDFGSIPNVPFMCLTAHISEIYPRLVANRLVLRVGPLSVRFDSEVSTRQMFCRFFEKFILSKLT